MSIDGLPIEPPREEGRISFAGAWMLHSLSRMMNTCPYIACWGHVMRLAAIAVATAAAMTFPCAAQNLILNAGFEDYLGGVLFWPQWRYSVGAIEFAEGGGVNAHSGTRSLALLDGFSGASSYVYSTNVIAASPGDQFVLSVWIKTKSFSTSDGVRVALAQHNSSGTFLGFALGDALFPGNTGWTQLVAPLTATNPTTARVSVYLFFLNSQLTPVGSTVFFDDACMTRASAPANMNVLGNGQSITNGDNTPTPTDWTDIGTSTWGEIAATREFTITNSGSGQLLLTGNPRVVVSGDQGISAFSQPAAAIPPGGVSTFQIGHLAVTCGVRRATVSLGNNDASGNPFTFSVQSKSIWAEMHVLGNSGLIPDGDDAPSVNNNTDFGWAPVSSGSVTHTFTVLNWGEAALNLNGTPKVIVGGTHAADFLVTVQPSSPVAATNGTTTFAVRFDPSGADVRSATISIPSRTLLNNPYNFSIQGIGTTPPQMQMLDVPIGGTVVLRWTSYTNHLYTLYQSTNMANGFLPLQGNIPATAPVNTYTDSVSGTAAKFWKVSTVE